MKGIHTDFFEHFDNNLQSGNSYNNVQSINQPENRQNKISDYYHFNRAFSDNEIQEIFKIASKQRKEKGKVPTEVDLTYRSSNISWIPKTNETQWLYRKVNNLIDTANKNAWNFDLSNEYENIQVGEYNANEGGHYQWHVDIGDNSLNRKLSVSVQLTSDNNYTGGNLQFLTNRELRNAPKNKGDVIIFPSYLLHRVNKVTSGTRRSLVMWRHGPQFK